MSRAKFCNKIVQSENQYSVFCIISEPKLFTLLKASLASRALKYFLHHAMCYFFSGQSNRICCDHSSRYDNQPYTILITKFPSKILIHNYIICNFNMLMCIHKHYCPRKHLTCIYELVSSFYTFFQMITKHQSSARQDHTHHHHHEIEI